MTTARPPLLIIMNQPLSGCLGQVDGYERLVASGDLEFVETVAMNGFREGARDQTSVDRVTTALRSSSATHVMVWSPGLFPNDFRDVDKLDDALAGRPLIYWEGDAWGHRKPISAQMSWWLKRSEIVFSVSGAPMGDMLRAAGGRNVNLTFHTYCHIKFGVYESSPSFLSPRHKFSFVGNNTSQVPFISGLPGSAGRWELILRMRAQHGSEFQLFGGGWPRKWSQGPIDYDRQIAAMHQSLITVNWDHYPNYSDYSSDRLPIALLAGRPLVTTRHPGMAWAPTPELGLYQEDTPKLVSLRAAEILARGPSAILALGQEAHSWTAGRLSHREAARSLVSRAIEGIEPPNMEPWTSLN